MCCGGTVASSGVVAWASSRPSSAARFCAVLVMKPASVLAFARGCPVLPEVKPTSSTASGSISRGGPSRWPKSSGRRQNAGGSGSSAASPMQTAPGCSARIASTTAGAREGGSSVTCPRRAAAHSDTMKR